MKKGPLKVIGKIFLIILILFCLTFIFRNQLARAAFTVATSWALGTPIKVDNLSFDLYKQSVKISGLKIYNPKGFMMGVLIDLPKINVVYDLEALKKGKIHIPSVEIELKEMLLEKNKDGELNVDSLKIARKGQDKNQAKTKEAKAMPMRLDLVRLDIGKIVRLELGSDKQPVVRVHEINIHKTYKNITSGQQLALLILTEPMKAAGIEGAKIYGVTMLAGAGALPAVAAVKIVSKDSASHEFSSDFDTVFNKTQEVLKKMGKVNKQDQSTGALSGEIGGSQVYIKVKKKSPGKTEVVVSARKFLLPQPEVAGGVIYEISREIK